MTNFIEYLKGALKSLLSWDQVKKILKEKLIVQFGISKLSGWRAWLAKKIIVFVLDYAVEPVYLWLKSKVENKELEKQLKEDGERYKNGETLEERNKAFDDISRRKRL